MSAPAAEPESASEPTPSHGGADAAPEPAAEPAATRGGADAAPRNRQPSQRQREAARTPHRNRQPSQRQREATRPPRWNRRRCVPVRPRDRARSAARRTTRPVGGIPPEAPPAQARPTPASRAANRRPPGPPPAPARPGPPPAPRLLDTSSRRPPNPPAPARCTRLLRPAKARPAGPLQSRPPARRRMGLRRPLRLRRRRPPTTSRTDPPRRLPNPPLTPTAATRRSPRPDRDGWYTRVRIAPEAGRHPRRQADGRSPRAAAPAPRSPDLDAAGCAAAGLQRPARERVRARIARNATISSTGGPDRASPPHYNS